MIIRQLLSAVVCLLCLVTSGIALSGSVELQIPMVSAIDEKGVNVANMQVTYSIPTVAIGGAMGLAGSVSGFTNNFSFKGYKGYHDKYSGLAQYSVLGTGVQLDYGGPYISNDLYAMNVSDFNETVPFIVVVGGTGLTSIGLDAPADGTYRYEPLTDLRHKLAVDADRNYLKWTKPDGTVVMFRRYGTLNATAGGTLEKVIYPNGFTITVNNQDVRTNTGFLLKPIYGVANPVLDKPDSAVAGSASTTGWSGNPIAVKGINTAIEPCTTAAADCTLNKWPTATFSWPSGMPRSLYINYPISPLHPTLESGVFRVVDAQKRVTELHFQAQDLTVDDYGNKISANQVLDQKTAPRLVGIKTPDSKIVNILYTYSNEIASTTQYCGGSICPQTDLWLYSAVGIVKTGTVNGDTTTYKSNAFNDNGYFQNTSSFNTNFGSNLKVVTRKYRAGKLASVTSIFGETQYEDTLRNFPVKFDRYVERNDYAYICGNPTAMTKTGRGPLGADTTTYGSLADYPAGSSTVTTCTCTNPKTCNQALWIKDFMGYRTDYTYHTASGQIETVTQPANAQGIRAQTRYEYTPLSATYYNDLGNKITGTPIYLKTAEKYCTNSNFAGTGNGASVFTGSCGNKPDGTKDQEVVTRYEYEPKNLLLKGMTVTADGITKRTCYQYDIYGNKIGETQPLAKLAACN